MEQFSADTKDVVAQHWKFCNFVFSNGNALKKVRCPATAMRGGHGCDVAVICMMPSKQLKTVYHQEDLKVLGTIEVRSFLVINKLKKT